MKYFVCFFFIAAAYAASVNVSYPKGGDYNGGSDHNKVLPAFAVTATNFDKVTLSNVLNVVTAAYKVGLDTQKYTANVTQELRSIYPQFRWSGTYNALAYYVTDSLYAQISISNKAVLFLHAISNVCY